MNKLPHLTHMELVLYITPVELIHALVPLCILENITPGTVYQPLDSTTSFAEMAEIWSARSGTLHWPLEFLETLVVQSATPDALNHVAQRILQLKKYVLHH